MSKPYDMTKQPSCTEIKTEFWLNRMRYEDLNIIQKINMKGNSESYGQYWMDRKPDNLLSRVYLSGVASRFDGIIEWNKNFHAGYRY